MSRQRCEDLERLAIGDIDCGQTPAAWQYPPPGKIAVSVVCESARVLYGYADYHITIERTPCNYGGARAWWRCPSCKRRCGVLYGPPDGGKFSCRRCLSLGYASDTEDKFDRMERKQRKLEAALGVHNVDYRDMRRWTFVADKPKRMRWWTYDTIQWRITMARRDAIAFLAKQRL
jgi:hypothetical protein